MRVTKDPSELRRVTEIAALSGRRERDVIEASPLVRADGLRPHTERFAGHVYDLGDLLGRSRDGAVA